MFHGIMPYLMSQLSLWQLRYHHYFQAVLGNRSNSHMQIYDAKVPFSDLMS